ncbi:MAG: hypothetical protein HOY78_24035, partial [Saccharothrix sp.]|nr:hypothetical protein [Saccharothrix sp.]
DDDSLLNLDRAFDSSKKFDRTVSAAIGEDLKKYQKGLDDSRKVAKKSNDDPFYQQAQRECRGYDTCVRDRTKKLRDKNAKAIAKADADAKKSNSDPLYLQARRECGGYDTCVRERVKKLRQQAQAKPKRTATAPKHTTPKNTTPKKPVVTKPTAKKVDPAVAKKQYEEASRVCGGYDTCVKDRLAKVRDTSAKTTKPTTKPATKKKTKK